MCIGDIKRQMCKLQQNL